MQSLPRTGSEGTAPNQEVSLDHNDGNQPSGVEPLPNLQDSNGQTNHGSIERRVVKELGSLRTSLRTIERLVDGQGRTE